jgi:hypothetical protein
MRGREGGVRGFYKPLVCQAAVGAVRVSSGVESAVRVMFGHGGELTERRRLSRPVDGGDVAR